MAPLSHHYYCPPPRLKPFETLVPPHPPASQVHEAIREDPSPQATTKNKPAEKKKWKVGWGPGRGRLGG